MSAKAVSARQVGKDLLSLWGRVARGHESAVFEFFEELGLTITQMRSLQMLASSERELSVKEVSERLGLSFAATSRTVEGVLKRGWVERREDEHDRRVKRVRVSDQARVLIDRVDTARLQGLESWAADLSPVQRRTLLDALSDLPKERRR